jgi:nitrogenase molybdenum-cofactor synthesis protein NifE
MEYYTDNFPVPSDYFGILWALTGIRNAVIIEHGSTGNTSYNVMNYRVMNRQTPQGKLFSSGLDKDDVILGREERLVDAIREIDAQFRPEIIFVVATSVTGVIGLDLEGIVFETQHQVNARLMAFPSGGFCGDYQWGIKQVFRNILEEVVEEPKSRLQRLVNIIGPTTDTFNLQSDIAELERMLALLDIRVHTVFTAAIEAGMIKDMAQASLNIVTRDVGLDFAKAMEARFDVPYVYGLPFGIKGSVDWLRDIADKLDITIAPDVIKSELKRYGQTLEELMGAGQALRDLKIVVSCPFDYAAGLVSLINNQWGLKADTVILPVKTTEADAVNKIEGMGVRSVLIEPENDELEALFQNEKFDVIFGNYHHLKTAGSVPIKFHAAFPSFDYIYTYDGTPFVGFRGSAYLTQQLVNAINQHVEVLGR